MGLALQRSKPHN
ncbi:hypothetical protein EYZ11_012272 [Aspergillus tanneri]|uniref:Uncharacterized protein n=1 Tax=Aspergillus tanneri TaxID=1220188 RepID=A0A4S3J0P2_9EURO|nr:hypothetical protein EYZ11_012272 [Aspergillus tanneri]